MDKNFIENAIKKINQQVGDKTALCAFSGGVDSAVAAALVHKAIGERLICVFVDTGLMRKNEAQEVKRVFADQLGFNLIVANAEDEFLTKLAGVTDPEQKRKIIGECFIRVFEREAKKLGKVDFLVQGTIYPDIVESGQGKNALVKSHHNVGGLPELMDFEGIVEPVAELYKDEVRQVGRSLGLPQSAVERQPFPGPGLAVRVIGEITKQKLDVLREVDYIFCNEVEKNNLNIWQYFAVLTANQTVGVNDGKRVYKQTVALRAVNTQDAMTADFARIPYQVLTTVAQRICQEVPQIGRVVYDITTKPPATIEWE